MAEIKIAADSGGGTTSLKGPASTTSNAALTYTLPDATTGGVVRTTTTPGAIIAVKGVVKTDQWSYNTIDTWVDITGLSITHTLANSSNKLLLQYSVNVGARAAGYTGMLRLMNDSTAILIGDEDGSVIRSSNQFIGTGYAGGQLTYSQTHLYAPGDTSSHAYHLEARTGYSEYIYVNRNHTWNDTWNEYGSTVSTLTLMEVAA